MTLSITSAAVMNLPQTTKPWSSQTDTQEKQLVQMALSILGPLPFFTVTAPVAQAVIQAPQPVQLVV